jgi:hypothetical protein
MELEKQSSGHGGLRENSGRKLGSTQKLSAKEILAAITQANNGIPYEVALANDFIAARYGDDKHLVAKYHQLILSKVIADKVDITSNGQSIAPTLQFGRSELPDYIDVKPT